MANLDSVLDDALLAFEDGDEEGQPARAAWPPEDQAASASAPPTQEAANPNTESAASSSGLASEQQPGVSEELRQAAAAGGSTDSASTSGAPASVAAAADGAPGLALAGAASSTCKPRFDPLSKQGGGSKAFDPLGKGKGRGAGLAAPGGKRGSAGGGGSGSRPASGKAADLANDLSALIAEWSAAMHPGDDVGADAAAAAAAGSGSGASSVLRLLEEQTRRTVQQEAAMRPRGGDAAAADGSADAASAAAGDGSDGAGLGSEMNLIVDVVMQHLLSKEVLYQPMKEIRDKYPPWLQRHAAERSAEDRERYTQQYDCICRLCAAYESEPTNFGKLMALLQEMQACGEPPAEIVEDMAGAISADLPGLTGVLGGGGGGAGSDPASLLADLNPADLLADLPKELKGCPVQ